MKKAWIAYDIPNYHAIWVSHKFFFKWISKHLKLIFIIALVALFFFFLFSFSFLFVEVKHFVLHVVLETIDPTNSCSLWDYGSRLVFHAIILLHAWYNVYVRISNSGRLCTRENYSNKCVVNILTEWWSYHEFN